MNYYLRHRHLGKRYTKWRKSYLLSFSLFCLFGVFSHQQPFLLFWHNNLWNAIFTFESRGSVLCLFCCLLFAWAAKKWELRALIMGFLLIKHKFVEIGCQDLSVKIWFSSKRLWRKMYALNGYYMFIFVCLNQDMAGEINVIFLLIFQKYHQY